MTTREAARNPVYAILSGPSGGVAGALFVARKARATTNILTFDMGGTSTDVSLCQDGEPRSAARPRSRPLPHQGAVRRRAHGRRRRRLDRPRARADEGPARRPRVGRRGARARRRTAQGGEQPTVTDANVVVGHLPPRLIGGEMELDVDARAHGRRDDRGRDRPRPPSRRPRASSRSSNETMAGALRLVSVQRGHDPRDFALVAFGGAGPLHANAVAKLMGSFPVIVPPAPGLLCALGDLVADFRNEFARTLIRCSSDADPEDVARDPRRARAGAPAQWIASEGIAEADAARQLRRRHALSRPGLRDPGRARPRARSARAGSADLERATSTRCTSSSTGSGCTRRRPRSSTCARSGPATVPKPGASDRATRGGRGRVRRRRRREHTMLVRRRADADADLRPLAAARPAMRFSGSGGRDRVRLDDRRAARLRRRGRRALQHPHQPGGREMRRGTDRRAPHRGDPDRHRDRSDHARHHRERAEERPLRDGRRALPLGDEPGDPRAARRVPDDHRPARAHGRRAVRRLHQRDDGRLGSRRLSGRRDPLLRPVQVLGVDLAHERLARARADLLRGRARRLVEPVRPPDGRRRPAPGLAADRRAARSSTRGSSSRRSRSSSAAWCRRTSCG